MYFLKMTEKLAQQHLNVLYKSMPWNCHSLSLSLFLVFSRSITLSQVKVLVPNTTAGMIIGKGGNFIKTIKDDAGVYIQISQKSKDLSLQERCITIAGKGEYRVSYSVWLLSSNGQIGHWTEGWTDIGLVLLDAYEAIPLN